MGPLLTASGAVGYLLLLFTPGAWITFGLSLGNLPFWARLLIAAMLSPLVACGEFYAIRLTGIPFGTTAVILAIVNLPAIYLIWKVGVRAAPVDRSTWLVGAAAVVIPTACLLSVLIYIDARIYSPHGWYHADAVYMFARGNLVLEDPTLAGMRLPYPVWSPLAFQAVLSYLVNSPPVSSYVWSDLLSLIAVYGFAAGIAKVMGGGRLAQFGSGIFLLLGTSAVGHFMRMAPKSLFYSFDQRYAEDWLNKFQLSGPMALALGMLMAIIYLLVRLDPPGKELLIPIGLLLSGIGLFYPLLFPPAVCIIGVRALSPLVDPQARNWPALYREWLRWAVLVLVAALLTYGEIKFLTSDRLAAVSPVSLSAVRNIASKTLASVVATVLFLAGVALALRSCWKSCRSATFILLGGALANYVLYAVAHIPFYDNEYKFVFAVTMCLAVFPALALERIWREWPLAKAVPVLSAAGLLLLGPYSLQTLRYWPAPWVVMWGTNYEKSPSLDASEFHLKLDRKEPWSGVCDAVRGMTPENSILVVDNSALYYPQLTGRSLYVSAENRDYRGVNLFADDLDGDLRGFGRRILDRRRATLADLFGAGDAGREAALSAILALKRPVGIIAEPRHAGLLEWLGHRKEASRLYAENGLSLWLFDDAGTRAATSGTKRRLFAQWLGR